MVLLFTGRLKTNKNPAENQDIHMDFKIVIKNPPNQKSFVQRLGIPKRNLVFWERNPYASPRIYFYEFCGVRHVTGNDKDFLR